jgi:hypothetical protein
MSLNKMSDGNNFGLNDNYTYHEIFLDSLDCDSSTDSYFASTDWPLFQLATPIPNLAAIKIIEIQIPFSFYVFNNSNNTFLLSEQGGVTNAVVTIPIGNYNSTTLATQLATSLNAAGSTTYTVTFSGAASTPSTGKFSISSAAGAGNPFTLTFGANADDTGAKNPRLFLGFNGGANVSDSVTPTLVAPNVALISGPNYLYLNSKFLGPATTTLLPRGAVSLGSGTAGPQLAKIPINVQPGGTIYWQDPNPLMWFPLHNMTLLTQFDLYITVGNLATPSVTRLNGLSFSVKLGLLSNNQILTKQQGSDAGFPKSAVMLPRKRVLPGITNY